MNRVISFPSFQPIERSRPTITTHHHRGAPLRIAILIERFMPDAGGVENAAWQVAHGLARAGEEVTVFARDFSSWEGGAQGSGSSRSPNAAIARHAIRAPRLWQPVRVLAFARATARTAAAVPVRFDVLHSFSRTCRQDLYRAGGGSHADYLERTHSDPGRTLRLLSPRHRVQLAIERRVFRDSHQRIQCPSRLVVDDLSRRYGVEPERIFLLPNGVDLARFGADSAHEAGQQLRRRLHRRSGPVWLFPASGWRRKGLDVLLAALAHRPGVELSLWIAGRDDPKPWRRLAEQLGIADRLLFLGTRPDLEAVYHAVDGMVLPTRYDPFANVTLEAAAAGLPIVTSAANGAAEWLDGDLVRVDDTESPTALAAALDRLASADSRRRLGERAARRVAGLSWDEHVTRLRGEYARIVAARRRAPFPSPTPSTEPAR